MYFDKVVYGMKDNSCIINNGATRYYVPKADLEIFSGVITAPVTKGKTHAEGGSDETKTVTEFTLTLAGANCQIKVESKTLVDRTHPVTVTALNISQYEGSVKITGTDGKIIAYPTVTTSVATLSPESPEVCKQNKATYLQDLENRGLVVSMTPVSIGF